MMRCADTTRTRELARELFACEGVEESSAGADPQAVSRVCNKLRRPLMMLAGAAGFRSLLARALTLAKQESPGLAAWEVKPDGSLEGPDEETARAGAVLIAQLIGLLITFIGESLTLRLLHDVWLHLPDSQAGSKRNGTK